MTDQTCHACQVTLDYISPFRDTDGNVLCSPCYWKAASS
jgi:uncharacterized Zn finger protein (UPF0148 family)